MQSNMYSHLQTRLPERRVITSKRQRLKFTNTFHTIISWGDINEILPEQIVKHNVCN